jgi:hypothetical protein
MKPAWCAFHLSYWESRASTYFEHYLLILRRYCTNGTWHIAWVLCQLAVSRLNWNWNEKFQCLNRATACPLCVKVRGKRYSTQKKLIHIFLLIAIFIWLQNIWSVFRSPLTSVPRPTDLLLASRFLVYRIYTPIPATYRVEVLNFKLVNAIFRVYHALLVTMRSIIDFYFIIYISGGHDLDSASCL